MVDPFIFMDQMGPEVLRVNRGLDVAPHPHIGLATVTYLFEGELLHREHEERAALYQRHADNYLHQAKEVVEMLDRIVREDAAEHIILAGGDAGPSLSVLE